MHTVTTTRLINAPKDKVWAALDDLGNVSNYHPLVETSSITNGVSSGKGAERICNFYDGTSIAERVVDYVPNHSYKLAITDTGSFPLKAAVGQFKVRARDELSTWVSAEIQFEPKFGPLGWVMAQLLMKPQFKRIFNNLLKGLEDHLTTGQIVGKGGALHYI